MLYPLQLFIILFIDFLVIVIRIRYANGSMNRIVKTESPEKRVPDFLISGLRAKNLDDSTPDLHAIKPDRQIQLSPGKLMPVKFINVPRFVKSSKYSSSAASM